MFDICNGGNLIRVWQPHGPPRGPVQEGYNYGPGIIRSLASALHPYAKPPDRMVISEVCICDSREGWQPSSS